MTTESENVIFRKLDELKNGVSEINVRLALMDNHADRIRELEKQVMKLRLDRAKAAGFIAAGSVLGGALMTGLAQLLGW